ncbi:MAG: bifunctional oligoribonuclease/PAP phosphatase NrnA, partial [Planctomycetes bacterium]|nr:bifunctional oligoribonuclease/PAP phosphatase NrnA [Planctomycetota bacterium]
GRLIWDENSLLEKSQAIAILSENVNDNLKALRSIRDKSHEKFVIVSAADAKEATDLLKNGADVAIKVENVLAKEVVTELENIEIRQSSSALIETIKEAGDKGIAIFLQDNPDPDAIASGMALKRIVEQYDIKAKIYYGGNIGHQQNKALVNLLNTELFQLRTPAEAMDMVRSAGKTALVEASIPSKNNILPVDVVPDIIFDHHQTDLDLVKGHFVDIRTKIGANSTILTGYIQQLGIPLDPPLATALIYGIKSDTNGFTRNTTTPDWEAVAFLSPAVDVNLLHQIETPPRSPETIDIIGRAIRNREIKGSYLVSFVEFINDRDALPQAADLLLQLEGVDTVLVFGISEDRIQLSARSRDPRVNLGIILQKTFGKSAGGHATMAGGTIDLGILSDASDKKALLKVTSEAVKKKFFSSVGVEFEKEEPSEESPSTNGNNR